MVRFPRTRYRYLRSVVALPLIFAIAFVGCQAPDDADGGAGTAPPQRNFVAGVGAPSEYGLILLQNAEGDSSTILEMDLDGRATAEYGSITNLPDGQVPAAVAGDRVVVQNPDGEVGLYTLQTGLTIDPSSYAVVSEDWASTSNPTPMGFRVVSLSQALTHPGACVDTAAIVRYYLHLDDPNGVEQPTVWLIDEQGSINRRDGVFAVRADAGTEAVHFGIGADIWAKQVWFRAANFNVATRDVRYDNAQLGWVPTSQFRVVPNIRDSVRSWYGGTHSDFRLAAYSTFVNQAGFPFDRLVFGSTGNVFLFTLSPLGETAFQEAYTNLVGVRVIHYTDVRGDCPVSPEPDTVATMRPLPFDYDPARDSREQLERLCRTSGISHPACGRPNLDF